MLTGADVGGQRQPDGDQPGPGVRGAGARARTRSGLINTDAGGRAQRDAGADAATGRGRPVLPVGGGRVSPCSTTRVRQDLGLSSFISTGDYADVTGNDVMQYWEDDAATRVCLLSLDSIGNPRKFSRITRRLTRRKPVVVFAPGRASRSDAHRRTRRARARAGRGGGRAVPAGRGDGGAPARCDDRHRQDRVAAAVARRSAGADRHQLHDPGAADVPAPATRSGCSGRASRCCSARSPIRRSSRAAAGAALADPGCDSVVCAAVNVVRRRAPRT